MIAHNPLHGSGRAVFPHQVCWSTLDAVILHVRICAGGVRSTGVPTATPGIEVNTSAGTNYWGKLGSPKFRTIAHACYLEPRFLGSFRVDHPGVDRFDQHKGFLGTNPTGELKTSELTVTRAQCVDTRVNRSQGGDTPAVSIARDLATIGSRNANLMNLFVRHSHPNSPFSKSKDTLRNPIVARPKRPSKSSCGSESTSAITTLRAPRLPLPSETSVESHLT
jgi:hypothetical protein